MQYSKVVLWFLVCGFLQACKFPVEIIGQGDVISDSGARHCLVDDFPVGTTPRCVFTEEGAYIEVYRGEAKPGFQFRRWHNFCNSSLNNECHFNVAASAVEAFQTYTAPPLQAVFRPIVNNGFTTVFMGHSFMAPIVQEIRSHATSEGFGDHTTTTFLANGAQAAPLAFFQNHTLRAEIKSVLETGEVELFIMTYDPAFPTIEGYDRWVNIALGEHADTRFAIAVPWPTNPTGLTSTQFEAAYESAETAVNTLVDALRVKYPGVDFYVIPAGRSAVELYNLFDEGNLPDVSALVGATADSVFQDDLGNPGDVLAALDELVWFGAIYDVDLATYNYDPGYITDLKTIAAIILDNQDTRYHAPPEVDTDTDGDGIVDRLDPNPTGKPNILVLMADDLGFNDLAINNGNTGIDTPNMDQIARDGVRFTRHYAAAVCSPARAAFLSGMYPERLGFAPDGLGIPPDVVTLPERLQQEGYTTWHIGKWHIGHLERTAWPDYQGFDHWFGFLNQWRLAGLHVDGELQMSAPTYTNPWLESDTQPGQTYPGHLENILTDKAIAVLSELHAAQAPWFLNLWFYAPHSPVQPASEFKALYPNTPAGRYQALVNQLDTNIGRIVSHLDAIGALQDTIVVVVSDNGGTNSALDNNAPYSGKKTEVTEGGLRTPLIIRWTDETLNGQVFPDVVSIEDIYPSLMAAINVTPPDDLDGDSFYNSVALQGPVVQKDRFNELATKNTYGGLAADGRWRLYQPYPVWGYPRAPRIYDLDFDYTGAIWEQPAPEPQLTLLQDSYFAWYRDVHTVKTKFQPNGSGAGILRGMDFMRTPGFGGYTFGIGISDDFEGPIAAQNGIWEISRTGNTVIAQYGELILSGEIESPGDCHSVVVSGSFGRQLQELSPPDRIILSLYIDGVEVQSGDIESTLAVPDPTVETTIGDPANPAQVGSLGNPVILNASLSRLYSAWTVASFGEEMCNPD